MVMVSLTRMISIVKRPTSQVRVPTCMVIRTERGRRKEGRGEGPIYLLTIYIFTSIYCCGTLVTLVPLPSPFLPVNPSISLLPLSLFPHIAMDPFHFWSHCHRDDLVSERREVPPA